jgi:probable rRNA maturation factor
MAEYESQVEISIDLNSEDDEAAFKHLFSSLPLEEVVSQTLLKAGIKQPFMLTLLITTDETIRNLNKRYRNEDKPTDVLSFPLLDKPIVNAPADQLWMRTDVPHGEDFQTKQAFVTPSELTMHLGDIVISWPTVIRQATEVGHNPAFELLFLLSHGVLHLIGYDDQTETGYQAMIRLQQDVIEATKQKL